MDSIDLGPVPGNETTCSRTDKEYWAHSRAEARAFVAQLRRQFGAEPEKKARLRVDTQRGATVVCDFWTQEGLDYALMLERQAPEHWDAIARDELRHQGYPVR